MAIPEISKVVFGNEVLIDLTGDTVTANALLAGITAHMKTGARIQGSIPNNGAVASVINGLTNTSVTIPAGYTTGGTVSLSDSIEEELAKL